MSFFYHVIFLLSNLSDGPKNKKNKLLSYHLLKLRSVSISFVLKS
jgi:hypothetical protein